MSGLAILPNLNITRRLFALTANMNVTTDQSMIPDFVIGSYIIDRIEVYSASTSLTTAAGGIYTAASKGNTAIVAAGQAYSELTTAAKTMAATLATTDLRTETPILSLTTGQGSAATAIVEIWGQAKS